MRILATQETDWISRNPIVRHRLLEWLSTHGSDVRVIDYDIDWAARKGGSILQGRQEFAGVHGECARARQRRARDGGVAADAEAHLRRADRRNRRTRGRIRSARRAVPLANHTH